MCALERGKESEIEDVQFHHHGGKYLKRRQLLLTLLNVCICVITSE
jgi:hypothetical protein